MKLIENKNETSNLLDFFKGLLLGATLQSSVLIISGLLFISFYFTRHGELLFKNIGIAYFIFIFLYFRIKKIKSSWTKIGSILAGLPMILLFFIMTFYGITFNTRITDLPQEKIEFEQLPYKVQFFF